MVGLNWGIRIDNPSQHCTVGAMWAFYLLTGLNAQFEIRNSFRIGGGGIKEIDEIKHALMKEGVFWGRVCNGNKNGNSPVDNPSGCFHSFVMLIQDVDVTIYQTMQGSWAMSSEYGIKSYKNEVFWNWRLWGWFKVKSDAHSSIPSSRGNCFVLLSFSILVTRKKLVS